MIQLACQKREIEEGYGFSLNSAFTRFEAIYVDKASHNCAKVLNSILYKNMARPEKGFECLELGPSVENLKLKAANLKTKCTGLLLLLKSGVSCNYNTEIPPDFRNESFLHLIRSTSATKAS